MAESAINPDAFLGRRQTAAELSALGYKVAEATLASKATRGGGPPMRSFGKRVLYRWGDALAWAESKLTAPYSSTSEIKTPSVSVSGVAGAAP
jgi:hypothetical protein